MLQLYEKNEELFCIPYLPLEIEPLMYTKPDGINE